MALVSPGVQVSITDESFFSSSGPGTVPLIMIATKQDKLTPDGSGIAAGTTAANADSLYLISSQRELLQTFGDPDFNEIGGTAQNGYPLNEYGLLAAYSYLGAANRAYVVRADVDLTELEATSVEPTSAPADGTYWLDTTNTTDGLFRWNGTAWVQVTLGVVIDHATLANNVAEPSSGYQNGDQIVHYKGDGTIEYYQRMSGVWRTIGGTTWRATGGTGGSAADFQWGPNAAEPTKPSVSTYNADALDTDSYWLKTSTENNGLDLVLSHYDSSLGQFVTDTVSVIEDTHAAYYSLTGISSASIEAGTVVGFIDRTDSFYTTTSSNSESRPLLEQATSEANITLEVHSGATTTVVNGGTITVPGDLTIATGSTFDINGVTTADLGASNPTVYADINALIIALNADAALTGNNIVASLNTAGDGIALTATDGTDIELSNFLVDAGNTGLIAGTTSNFSAITLYEASATQPVGPVTAGTYWYDPSFLVDLMENDGTGNWAEPAGTVYIQSDEPTSGLTAGDIWIETDDVANYPKVYRYTTDWVLVDNTDQITSAGIIFADARATSNIPDPIVPSADASATLDADAPDPLLYPGGTLLWNTRHSGRNVKVWTENATALSTAPTIPVDRWVSASGNAADGSLITGSDAQKAVVTEKLGAVLIGNEQLRDDTIFYNLIATPGFPELIDEMITLNVDRKEQAFVIGDSPFNLSNSTTALQAWSSNSAGASGNGEDGLVTADTYLGVYYPSGLSTNVDGNEVVVPASHMVLRVMAQNDQTAYPWYAPAGFSRGTVTNATSVGYLNSSDEFVPVSLTQGQRDVLQQNNVNPIANIPNRGLVVFGQKTRQSTASALDRVNVARLVNYVRFQSDQLAQPFLFEPNDSVTRGAVKDAFDSFLAGLVTLRGLNDFLVVVDESNNTPARIDNNELWIDIAIQPIKSVEFIFIPIRIRNTGDDLNL